MEETIITSSSKIFDFKIKEIIQYRDLIFLFVKRNFSSQYKQTILGPIWFILNPLISTVLYTIVFGGIAGLSTDGVPSFIFYLASTCIWQYFSTCIKGTSNTFVANSGILGKVYFPRLVMPISTVIYSALNFVVVFVCTVIAMIVYFCKGVWFEIDSSIFIIPLLVLQTAILSLGVGIIISALTTKYRDLQILVTFGVDLWMYMTPVVYTLDSMPESYRKIIMLNPMSPIVVNFRHALLGTGDIELFYWGISAILTLVILFIGVLLFNHVEKTFMDTV